MIPVFLSFLYCLISSPLWAVDATRTSGIPVSPTLPGQQAFQFLDIAEHVSLDSFEGSIQGYELQCEQGQNGKIGFCGGDCNSTDVSNQRGATLSKDCATFIDFAMPQCLLDIGCEREAAFCGVGGHAKRSIRSPSSPGSGTPSRHSTGDALDLFGLKCKDINGADMSFDFSAEGRRSNSINQQKYDQFVACWRAQVIKYHQQNGNKGGGAISCQGSAPPTNEFHNDHVHIACPVKRNNVAEI